MTSAFSAATSTYKSLRSTFSLETTVTTTDRLWLRSGIGMCGVDQDASWYDGTESWPSPAYWDPSLADAKAPSSLGHSVSAPTLLTLQPGNDRNTFKIEL